MKIVKLQAENFKRLSAVEITPDGNVVTITGKNAAGKSSVLDAIFAALCGGTAQPDKPIREGQASAEVTVDLDEFTVTRHWGTAGNTSIVVKTKDGLKYPSPQKMLDGLMGKFTFDPAVFLAAPDKDQRAMLLKTIELKPDWAAWKELRTEEPVDVLAYIDERRKALFNGRADVGRDVKKLEGAAKTLKEELPAERPERISSATVLTERDAAEAHNRQLMAQSQKVVSLADKENALVIEIARLQKEVETVKEMRALATEELATCGKPINLSEFSEKMKAAEAQNAVADKFDRFDEAVKGYRASREQYTDLTARIEAVDNFRAGLLEKAALPVPGLGLDNDGGVTLDGIPFTQASHAQRLRVALAVAMAGNPKLKVCRISDGEKFDSESWKIIESMAAEKDFQVWIEKMDESGEFGIFIEDGAVRGQNLQPTLAEDIQQGADGVFDEGAAQ